MGYLLSRLSLDCIERGYIYSLYFLLPGPSIIDPPTVYYLGMAGSFHILHFPSQRYFPLGTWVRKLKDKASRAVYTTQTHLHHHSNVTKCMLSSDTEINLKVGKSRVCSGP